MGMLTVLSATGLAAGLAVTGVGVGVAHAGGGTTLPPGGVLEQRVTRLCAHAPRLEQRAQKAQARLGGDAGTKGSITWLKARQAHATKEGHDKVAKKLGREIDRRTKRLAKLPTVQQNLTKATGECTSIGLPTTPAPSSS